MSYIIMMCQRFLWTPPLLIEGYFKRSTCTRWLAGSFLDPQLFSSVEFFNSKSRIPQTDNPCWTLAMFREH